MSYAESVSHGERSSTVRMASVSVSRRFLCWVIVRIAYVRVAYQRHTRVSLRSTLSDVDLPSAMFPIGRG